MRGSRRIGRFYPLFYPLLFTIVPALEIAARSAGQFRYSDLALVLAVLIIAAGLAVLTVFIGLRALDRTDRAMPLAAAVVMLAVAWCFYYLPVQDALSHLNQRVSRGRLLVPLGVMVTLATLAWLRQQSRERLLSVSAFMTRLGLLLVVILAIRTVVSAARGPGLAKRSGLVRELALPVRSVDPPRSGNTPRRDIYLIVLDGHANAAVLEEVFGFDDSRFEDSLRALEFLVPREVRSNYVQTYLSVSSLLNSAHMTRLTEDAGLTSKDHSLPTYLVKHNRAARFLKARGYKYVLFPSAWWAATANSPLADEEFDPTPKFGLLDEARRSELRFALVRSSLFRFTLGSGGAAIPLVEHFLRSFEGLAEVPADPAPTFTFAHILLPHVPYLVDERCRPLKQPVPDHLEADTPEQRADYIGQVRCVDRLVLDLVTKLLKRSPTPPVILVVGDHGPRFADVGFYGHPESVSAAFIRERFGAFGAFYLPAGGDRAFGEPVTLVNVLGNVLRYYFNAELPASGNDLYVSGEQLYRFYRVDPGLLGKGMGTSPRHSLGRELRTGTRR